MNIARLLLLWLLLACHATPALAREDHITRLAVLEDRDGTLDVKQAAARAFAPAPPVLAMGYTRAVHWLRLEVRPRADGGALVLRIRPTHIDAITLFEPDPQRPGHWTRRSTGEATAWMEREHTSTQHAFTVRPQAPATYYLRLQSTRSSILQAQALTPLQAQRADVQVQLGQWLFLSVMASLLVWAVHDHLQSREPVVAWFAAAQAAYLLYGMAITGLFAPLLPTARRLPELTVALACTAALVSLAFHRKLLALFQPPRALLGVLDALIAASAWAMLLCLGGRPLQGMHLNSLVVLAAGIVFFALALAARRDALPGRRTLRVLYGVLMLSLLATFAPLLGLAPATAWNLQGGLLQGLLGAGMMGSVLYLRSRGLRRQGLQAQWDLARSQLQLQEQQAKLQEQQHFMAMLTHEVKNPLTTLRWTLDMLPADPAQHLRMDRAIGSIETIVERCRQVDRMEQGGWPLHPRACDLHGLVQEAAAHCQAPQRLRLAHAHPAPALRTDPVLLSMALGNLIDNALKYGAPDTPVLVRTAEAAENGQAHVRIEVVNHTGSTGLPEDAPLCQKYYRGPNALGQSGCGLGLYLVQGIMARLGGRVGHATEGACTVFTLTQPLQGPAP
ncbi:MAG: hypothetical protein J0H52_12835 [Comamonadaceae bacterium]|nr:hypothetical protein [Comamonadaceae bacterium]